MIDIPMKITSALEKRAIAAVSPKITSAFDHTTVTDLGRAALVAAADSMMHQNTFGGGASQQTWGTQQTVWDTQQSATSQTQWGVQQPVSSQQQWGVQQPVSSQQPQWGVQQPVTSQQQWGVQQPVSSQQQWGVQQPVRQPAPPRRVQPALHHILHKGQKTALSLNGAAQLQVCFGWQTNDARCELDASAFLLTRSGKTPGDEWLVFYGQEASPDGSTASFAPPQDCTGIRIDLRRLNPAIEKIAFVLTLHEAFQQRLNFSMVSDVYLRVLREDTGEELVSYRLEEYYPNVTSMTIGELYLHNGQWKFNPVGNGVHKDLADQCAVYGVRVG